jgi:hypothetical protein
MKRLLASSWHRFRARAADRRRLQNEFEHKQEFAAFYDSLRLYSDPVYVFFSGGLLHWVTKTAQFAPPDVNLVLIGTGLTPEETAYLRLYVNRPLHVIGPRVWDTTVWEWLFDVNRTNFGWLDVDCFVLNPQLFDEMNRLPDDVAMNGCWLTYQGWAFLATYFLFINHRALTDMRARMPGISPRMYHPWWDSRPGEGYANLLTETDFALVRQMGSLKQGFDTMQFYQLACLASGYELGTIRNLKNDPEFNDFCSEELLHMTGVSWYRQRYLSESSPFTHDLVVRAVMDYLLLDAADLNLPSSYATLKEQIRRMLGGDPRDLRKYVYDFLRTKGLTEQAFSRPELEFLGCSRQHLRQEHHHLV